VAAINIKQTSEIVWKQSHGSLDLLKRLAKNKAAIIGLSIIFFLLVVAVFAPFIAPFRYDVMDADNILKAPTSNHLFGTDELGRDIFSRVVYGARYSLSMGILSMLMSATVGMFFGAIAGYFGGIIGNLVMRATDVMQALPGLLMVIVISSVLGTGFFNTILALSISAIPMYTRMMRASILTVRAEEYIEAVVAINCSHTRIIIGHIIPNTLSPIIVSATMNIAGTIMAAAALSFVGLGIQPPTPEWGAMLAGARNYIRDYNYMIIFPGIVLALAVLSFNLLGDGLRDALDPKLKK
jgi:peptide/nickel transport system permease protein